MSDNNINSQTAPYGAFLLRISLGLMFIGMALFKTGFLSASWSMARYAVLTALDVTVQAQILELLADLRRKKSMSMLFITHDLGIVRKVADRVCVMTDGKIVESGPTEEIFTNPQHAYTRHLIEAEPKGRPPKADPTAETVMKGDEIKVWFL